MCKHCHCKHCHAFLKFCRKLCFKKIKPNNGDLQFGCWNFNQQLWLEFLVLEMDSKCDVWHKLRASCLIFLFDLWLLLFSTSWLVNSDRTRKDKANSVSWGLIINNLTFHQNLCGSGSLLCHWRQDVNKRSLYKKQLLFCFPNRYYKWINNVHCSEPKGTQWTWPLWYASV